MSYENTNRLALWFNDRRDKTTSPHLKGQGDTNVPVWVNAWFSQDISDEDKQLLMGILKRYNSKKPFLSITIKPKGSQTAQARQAAQGKQQLDNDFYDDDLPHF